MSWRGDPSTAFSRIKNVAVEPNISNLQSTIKRESTLNPDKRASGERERTEQVRRVLNPIGSATESRS